MAQDPPNSETVDRVVDWAEDFRSVKADWTINWQVIAMGLTLLLSGFYAFSETQKNVEMNSTYLATASKRIDLLDQELKALTHRELESRERLRIELKQDLTSISSKLDSLIQSRLGNN